MGEGRLVAEALGIVAGGYKECRRGVGSDAQGGDQLGRGLFDQGLQDGIDLGDLLESARESWRLLPLRGWSNAKKIPLSARGA